MARGSNTSKGQTLKQSRFATIENAQIPRSSFDRSSSLKTTFDGGYLVPVFIDEALPGDVFNLKMSAFIRLATPIKPIMDNLYADTFFFSVPNRILWENWVRMMGEQDNPTDSIDYATPTITLQTDLLDDLYTYFGLPYSSAVLNVNSLPFRAYNKIWNQWFRDENLQGSATERTTDTGDVANDFKLLRRGKRHDYFTSCLPWPQKGDPVEIPLGTQAPIIGLGIGPNPTWQGTQSNVGETGGVTSYTDGFVSADAPADRVLIVERQGTSDLPAFYADLASATAATINDLRRAFQVQRLLERDARGGTRYTEIIRSHFGVVSPDARQQRATFLGGGSAPIMINPIAQTQRTESTPGNETPQGNLSAIGIGMISGHGFTQAFTEHCWIIGLISVRADLTYQNGVDRMWSRSTRFDYYWPALSHIGEQAVLNKEIFADGSANDDLVFGYQERYAEFRYKPSRITGLFASNRATSLDVWHLAQDFDTLPTLSSTFIEDNPPIDRIIAVQDEPHFLMDAFFNLRCARPMPMYGTPGMIDHF